MSYSKGRYLQIIEGHDEGIAPLIDKINADQRLRKLEGFFGGTAG